MNLQVNNPNKHIWEGWTVQMFIDDLQPTFDMIMAGHSWQKIESLTDLKRWCMDNQPYYKKHIPEVYDYFSRKFKAVRNE